MANFEDELLLDAELDAQEVEYIQQKLQEANRPAMEEDDIYYLIDVIATYYAESGILDSDPDADGCIELPVDAICEYIQNAARKELGKDFSADDINIVIESDMDFAEEYM